VLPRQPVADEGGPELLLLEEGHVAQESGDHLLDGQALRHGHPYDLLGQRTEVQHRNGHREREVLAKHVVASLERVVDTRITVDQPPDRLWAAQPLAEHRRVVYYADVAQGGDHVVGGPPLHDDELDVGAR